MARIKIIHIMTLVPFPGFACRLPTQVQTGQPPLIPGAEPDKPPPNVDLPTRDGVLQPDVIAKMTANVPLAFIDQYVGNLGTYAAIAIDVRDQDGPRAGSARLHEALDEFGLDNGLDVYEGNHVNRVAYRFQDHVLPLFSQHLRFEAD